MNLLFIFNFIFDRIEHDTRMHANKHTKKIKILFRKAFNSVFSFLSFSISVRKLLICVVISFFCVWHCLFFHILFLCARCGVFLQQKKKIYMLFLTCAVFTSLLLFALFFFQRFIVIMAVITVITAIIAIIDNLLLCIFK